MRFRKPEKRTTSLATFTKGRAINERHGGKKIWPKGPSWRERAGQLGLTVFLEDIDRRFDRAGVHEIKELLAELAAEKSGDGSLEKTRPLKLKRRSSPRS